METTPSQSTATSTASISISDTTMPNGGGMDNGSEQKGGEKGGSGGLGNNTNTLLNSLLSISSVSSMSSIFSKSLPSSVVGAHTDKARGEIFALWTSAKPWGEFFNTKKFNVPTSVSEIQERLMDNLTYFSSNYIVCFLILSCASILIHPMSFVCVVTLACLYVYLFLQHSDSAIEIGPIKINNRSKVVVYAVVAFILLYLTNAIGIIGSWAVFGIVLSILHAGFRTSIKEPDFESPVSSV